MINNRFNKNGKRNAGLAMMLMLALVLAGILLPGTAAAVTNLVKVIHSAGETEYATLGDAVAAAQAGDIVQLQNNVTLGSALTISEDITLDLNGKTLQRSLETSINDGYVIYVDSGSALTLKDSGLSVSAVGAITKDADNKVSIPYTLQTTAARSRRRFPWL